jgi:hypothetical protein
MLNYADEILLALLGVWAPFLANWLVCSFDGLGRPVRTENLPETAAKDRTG